MPKKTLRRNIFQRLLGKCATREPLNRDCWTYSDGRVVIDLGRAPELSGPAGGIRLEANYLPERLLVIHGNDGRYHALRNRCGHMGRRLDPLPEGESVQCCSLGRTTCDYDGRVLRGPAKKPLISYPVEIQGTTLTVTVKSSTPPTEED